MAKKPRNSINSLKQGEKFFIVFLLVPALVFAIIFNVYPLINCIVLSFKSFNLLIPQNVKWVGLENYINIFKVGNFQISFGVTILFSFLSVIFLFLIGLFFAILLNRKGTGIGFARGLLMIPWAVPVFVSAFLWLWVIDVQFGILNYILSRLHIIGEFRNWLGDPPLAMIGVLMAYVWRVFPFNMVVYLAQLQSVDNSYYEAAEIDGAGWFQSFIYITIPLLRNVIVLAGILNLIWAFQEFTTIWLITRGGPGNATNVLSVYIYRLAFEAYDFGLASTAGVFWMIFLLVFSFFSFRNLIQEEAY